ncbi:hypothetical protein QHF83_02285 [Polyangium sp. 15x6]|nr:hypothetical protein [Polyangium sp. 15x6]
MPPKDIKPYDLWEQITALPRPHRVVPFPRFNEDGESLGDIAMVVLTQEEVTAANISAEKYVRKTFKDNVGEIPMVNEKSEGYANLFSSRASTEILFRACRKVDDVEKAFFPSREAIGQRLTTDEVAVLMNHYMRVQSELGPIVSNMSQEEMDAWVEMLAEGGNAYPLDLLSSVQLTTLLVYMASQLHASRKANSSPGTQPENGITTV